MTDILTIAGKEYNSRLIVGTGKYKDFEETKLAVEASGAEIVTVAVRRVNISEARGADACTITLILKKSLYFFPTLQGVSPLRTPYELCVLARAAGGWNLVKLEVLGDQKTLYPNMPETVEAAKTLVNDGFQVMVYCNDDPIQAKILEDIGCCAIMPLGAPIGSGLGIQNPVGIRIIVENSKVPVLVDAGVRHCIRSSSGYGTWL